MPDRPELLNAARDRDAVDQCVSLDGTSVGVEHDYRPFTDETQRDSPTYLRCVWCHAVACGNVGEPAPCIEPWHHEPKPHRAANGATWPIGGTR